MTFSRLAVALLAATSAAAAVAATDIYKCIAPDGRTAFQDSPCVADAIGDKLIVHPNVVVPIDQSASVIASQAITERVSARRRAAEDAALRERMLRDASIDAPVPQQVDEPPYFYGYAPYAYPPRAPRRASKAPNPQRDSHVPVEQRRRI